MAIIRKEAYYSSNDGMHKVRALIWADDTASPIGVLQISHGVCEHIARYDAFARYLVKSGFVVCGNDHLGHGKTSATISDLGWMEPGDHLNMLRDINALYHIMHKRYPSLPYFLFGHSMGSFLARLYAAQFHDELSGLILCGTMQLPAPVLLMNDPVQKLLDRLPEQFSMGDMSNAAFGKVTKKLLKEDDDLAWISKNKQNLENWRADPYCGFPIGNELARELVTLAVKACMPGTVRSLPADYPVMVISGGKDPVGFFGRGVIAFTDQLMEAGVIPEVILYPGDRHEILNEEDHMKVFADVVSFLLKCLHN